MIIFVVVRAVLKYSSIGLVAMTFAAVSWQTFVVIHFYANQDQIEAEHCENKDKPELQCHGKCHLQKQMEKTELASDQDRERVRTTVLFAFQLFEEISSLQIQTERDIQQGYSSAVTSLLDGAQHQLLDPPEYC